jgi:hypothetical protein
LAGYNNDGQFNYHSDEGRQQILENIQEYGCYIVIIEPDNYSPGFVYSIGLYQEYRHPAITPTQAIFIIFILHLPINATYTLHPYWTHSRYIPAHHRIPWQSITWSANHKNA